MYENRTHRETIGAREEFRVSNWTGSHNFESGNEAVQYETQDAANPIQSILYQGFRRNGYYNGRGPDVLKFRFIVLNVAVKKTLEDTLRSAGYAPLQETNAYVCVDLPEQPGNATYLDAFLKVIAGASLNIPDAIMQDLRDTIVETGVRTFKMKLEHKEGFEAAMCQLKPCALQGLPSPFYLAAEYCLARKMEMEAIRLIAEIPASHWQYGEAQRLIPNMLRSQASEIERLRAEIETLRSRDNSSRSTPLCLSGGVSGAVRPTSAPATAAAASVVVTVPVHR